MSSILSSSLGEKFHGRDRSNVDFKVKQRNEYFVQKESSKDKD